MSNLWRRIHAEFDIWRIGALPGLAIIASVVVARYFGGLQFLELVALDNFLRWRPPEPMDERIVIVGITQEDIDRVDTYPIPDRDIANLIKQLQTYQPEVIGLDIFRDKPVEPGHGELTEVFRTNKNLIVIEQALRDRSGFTVSPPPALSPEQVGFADAVLDKDGKLRRSLLGASNPKGEYRFSLTIRLAEKYLATKGMKLENGIRDSVAMRFDKTELTRFQPNTGGYVGGDAGGNQILLNFRSGKTPFRFLTFSQVQQGKVTPEWIRDRIVLIGVTALSVKDVVNSGALVGVNPGLVYGVEIQAHAVSQIISAVQDERPLLQVWLDGWEYLWIIGWGIVGISLGRFLRSPWKILLALVLASGSLIIICYGLIIIGWWIPVVPALLVLVFNGAGLTAALFYRYQQDIKLRLQERQFIIEHTFNAIHNGPLQNLARMLREAQGEETPSPILPDLQHLNQELRAVYEAVRRETLSQGNTLHLNNLELDLQEPLHELLQEVYFNTLERDFPCFQTIKAKVVRFEALDTRHLSLQHKQALCRFLEEALCNVGKYAVGVTRLTIICAQEQGLQVVRVIDNGIGISTNTGVNSRRQTSGLGTRQAKNLARQLGGKFRRYPKEPRGTVCELTWAAARFWFWQF